MRNAEITDFKRDEGIRKKRMEKIKYAREFGKLPRVPVTALVRRDASLFIKKCVITRPWR